jgi:metal-responsive CopG/Arc/MetJ family transcriptional regulator
MVVRLGKGVPERIDDVLQDKESRASFIRKAIDEELKRRERAL